jgi:hypothetical protein
MYKGITPHGMPMLGDTKFDQLQVTRGPGSSVGIATELRAGRSGDRIPVGARFSAPVQTGPESHPASCAKGTGSLPGIRCCRGVTLTPHPLLVLRSKTEQSCTSILPTGLCGLWKGETYLQVICLMLKGDLTKTLFNTQLYKLNHDGVPIKKFVCWPLNIT